MFRSVGLSLSVAVAALLLQPSARAGGTQPQITSPVNESNLVRLSRNTHPLARPEFDRGAAAPALTTNRMLLVLKRSAAQQAALDDFLKAVHDPKSAVYHHWLTPDQFGAKFGVADSDVAKISAWLKAHGFQVGRVARGRNVLEFSGTAASINGAFHTSIHRYRVNGKDHLANDSDPQIPAAFANVLAGVSTMHDFRKAPQIARLKPQAKLRGQAKTGQFTSSSGDYALAPGDFANIYNTNPVYTSGIDGTGTAVAVISRTDINLSDINDFRNAFGLSNNLPLKFYNGPTPGNVGDGDEAEAVLDTSWAGATAPGTTVDLVISASTDMTDGVDLSEEYVIDNNLADVMTESYGDCEANYTQAQAQFYGTLAEQAAAQGISFTVAAGDSGAEGCDDPGSVIVASGPVSVNVLAATPYNIAVGGTQLNENGNYSQYWASSNSSSGTSVLGYIPEVAWNESCLQSDCGDNAGIWAGSGGSSIVFPKPSWQNGVSGIPFDGMRDLPDVSFTSAGHDFYLICLDGSCVERRGLSYFAGVSGTSAATPSFAGILALVVQQTGSRQGQAANTLYALAANQALASCNASDASLPPASNCIFNDVTSGNNAVPGEVGYGTSSASYQAGVGYDLVTGLGSVNVANLVNNWNNTGSSSPRIRIGIASPTAQNATVAGAVTFYGWALADTGTVTSVTVAVDSVPKGAAVYGLNRPDVCTLYSSANCPAVGWTFVLDSQSLANGSHSFDITVKTNTGQTYTTSSTFNVANWTANDPLLVSIDSPFGQLSQVSGSSVNFNGWALGNLAGVNRVGIRIDGVSYGNATYGSERDDVCEAFPGRVNCPNVGWQFTLDSTQLADGTHTLSVTPTTSGGQSTTASAPFTVANNSANPISLFVDYPNVNSTASLSGNVVLSGWALARTTPVSGMTATIDGNAFGQLTYGVNRADVCSALSNPPGCPKVGWQLPLDTTALSNGSHTASLTAFTAAGQRAVVNASFTVQNAATNGTVIFVDNPGPYSSVVSGTTSFHGWAVAPASLITSLVTVIDGAAFSSSVYGSSRPDACGQFPQSKNCPNVGWELPIDTYLLANGSHTLSITALNGTTVLGAISQTFTVANWSAENPTNVFLDNPSILSANTPVSGLLTVSGWAVDKLSPIYSINISVDNVPFGAATQTDRQDVCDAVGGGYGCPNVGFTFALDTATLSDGAHELGVTTTTSGGRSNTFSQTFQVGNLGSSPANGVIDAPSPLQTVSGDFGVHGWAVRTDGVLVSTVKILVDGVVVGYASYGVSRPDVCNVFPNGTGCPAVGWEYALDSTQFANGGHTVEATTTYADGLKDTRTQLILIANQP